MKCAACYGTGDASAYIQVSNGQRVVHKASSYMIACSMCFGTGQQTPVDCEGHPLRVGDEVVYNLSGGLVRGVITKIVPRTDYVAKHHPNQYHLQFCVHIGDSVVKNTEGIFLLRRP